MTTLMSSPDGVRLLSSEDSFLEQIKKSFAQLDPVSFHHFKISPLYTHKTTVQRRARLGSNIFQKAGSRDLDIWVFGNAWSFKQVQGRH